MKIEIPIHIDTLKELSDIIDNGDHLLGNFPINMGASKIPFTRWRKLKYRYLSTDNSYNSHVFLITLHGKIYDDYFDVKFITVSEEYLPFIHIPRLLIKNNSKIMKQFGLQIKLMK